MNKDELRILQVGDVLVSPNIITEKFCCDLDACKGECCIEGDAGAPVSLDEIMEIENMLDVVWEDLSASAQAVIDKQTAERTLHAVKGRILGAEGAEGVRPRQLAALALCNPWLTTTRLRLTIS